MTPGNGWGAERENPLSKGLSFWSALLMVSTTWLMLLTPDTERGGHEHIEGEEKTERRRLGSGCRKGGAGAGER